jgi:fibronectin-binding autotransporter adhesin
MRLYSSLLNPPPTMRTENQFRNFLKTCFLQSAAGFAITAFLLPLDSSQAASGTWNGTVSADWLTNGNWTGATYPGTSVGETATFSSISNSNTTITGFPASIRHIAFADGAAAYTLGVGSLTLETNGTITMASGVANDQLINTNLRLGADTAAGSYSISNNSATNSLTLAGTIQGGASGGTAGVKNLGVSGAGAVTLGGAITAGGSSGIRLRKTGTGTLTLTAAGTTLVGSGVPVANAGFGIEAGTVVLESASGVTTANTTLGAASGETATLNIKGGTHDLGAMYLSTVVGGAGVVNQTGGTVTLARLGNEATAGTGSSGTYNISAGSMAITTSFRGTFNAGDTFHLNISGNASVTSTTTANYITRNGTGTVTIGGSALFDLGSNSLALGETGGGATPFSGTGTLNLNGGTLRARAIAVGNTTATSIVNFNGGTFLATEGSNQNIMSQTEGVFAYVKAGGAIFDTNGNDVRLFANLLHDSALGSTLDGGFTKKGAGTISVNGASTYTGATNILGGTVLMASATATLGVNSAVSLANVANVSLNLSNRSISIGSLSGGGASGGSVIMGSGTLTTGGNNEAATFAGVISGTGGLIKNGSGVQSLSGANTYAGNTTINAGTLLVGVGGAGSIDSIVTVNAGTLGGSGQITKNVTIGNSSGSGDAVLAPGNSAGTLTITGSLNMLSDAKFAFELNGITGTADKVAANGITINSNAAFEFSLLGNLSGVQVEDQFTILDNTGVGNISGTFSNLTAGGTFDAGGGLTFAVSGGSGVYGNDLILTVTTVPEPTASALVLMGLLALASRPHRRHRRG